MLIIASTCIFNQKPDIRFVKFKRFLNLLTDMTDLHALAHFTPDFSKYRKTFSKHNIHIFTKALWDLKNKAIVQTWLLTERYPVDYYERYIIIYSLSPFIGSSFMFCSCHEHFKKVQIVLVFACISMGSEQFYRFCKQK